MNTRKFFSVIAAAALASTASLQFTAAVSAESAPPEPPSGGLENGGTPPEMPSGGFGNGETPPEKPGGMPGGSGAPGGGSSAVSEWDAVTEYSSDTETTGESYTSTGTDENAVHISAGNVIIKNSDVSRTSSDSTGGDNSSFYGVGAAVLATGGVTYIDGGEINTDSKGGAGAFAYGDGKIYIRNTKITTKQSTSGGVHAAGGGTLYAWDLDVETNGESSAAIRSDRGGGTMVIDGGTYTSNGTGSPAVYCTADITVNDAELNATGSEGICIEGLNSLYIYDSDLTADMPVTAQNENLTWAVIVYQSMSGDSEVGNSEFYYDGGSISTTSDILIYTTNTESHITLNNVDIKSDSSDLVILRATGNSNGRGWGSTGSNGSDCTFTAIAQELDGNIVCDSISELEFYLTDGSVLTGAVLDDESDAGSGGNKAANIYIDSTSKWVVTADSVCTNLYNAGTIADANGKTVTIKDASGNVLSQGESTVTITVSGTYAASADTSGATAKQTYTAVDLPVAFGGTATPTAETSVTATANESAAPAENGSAAPNGSNNAPASIENGSAPASGNNTPAKGAASDRNPQTGTVIAVGAATAFAAAAAVLAAKRKK